MSTQLMIAIFSATPGSWKQAVAQVPWMPGAYIVKRPSKALDQWLARHAKVN